MVFCMALLVGCVHHKHSTNGQGRLFHVYVWPEQNHTMCYSCPHMKLIEGQSHFVTVGILQAVLISSKEELVSEYCP